MFKQLTLLACLMAVLLAFGCGDDGDNSNEEDTSENDTGTGQASLHCPQDCAASGPEAYTACSCDPSDPCGWSNDGSCDIRCLADFVVETMFDDSQDCTADPTGPCSGACEERWLFYGLLPSKYYTQCTCGAEDPCDWSDDGICDVNETLYEGQLVPGACTELVDSDVIAATFTEDTDDCAPADTDSQ